MAQKTKVKELVGRGLNSYHTKALQQIHRIEKKNKEQNHKISILSNELDNDYLTKTEEGSVISLEHSKEGMIYLDELQGNTLVNYCTDGSKELTLNGDIDVEGTFVTTTEGVDNGKVDIMCEGNTLVNNILNANKNDVIFTTSKRTFTVGKDSLIKDNTDYTVIFKISDINLDGLESASIQIEMIGGFENHGKIIGVVNKNGIYKFKHTTSTRVGNGDIVIKGVKGEWEGSTSTTRTLKISEVMLLEGDWTNKEIPSEYFEGMKSVGQDDENGHKIEILSAKGKPNLFKNSGFLSGSNNYNIHYGATCEIVDDSSTLSKKAFKFTTGITGTSGVYQNQIIPYIENIKYTISGWCKGEVGTTLQIHIERHKSINVNFTNEEWVRFEITSELNPTNWNRTITFYSANNSKVFYLKDIKAEKSDFATPYMPHTTESHYSSFMNKKEILINEPLRKVGDVNDRFIKIGNKWFIERKCKKIIFDGSSDEDWKFKTIEPSGKYSYQTHNNPIEGNTEYRHKGICDKLIFVNWIGSPWNFKSNCISTLNRSVFIYTDFATVSELKTWLQSNPITLIYELPTPIYEPLEIEPTLNTYNDITHISNNSIIPCNMKIKNTGYNAIIKPNTLYTVALDINKSGTVGMNLGGAKVTTTNNVATITTPATLVDDSLRLYGKGIKGSKVRLLEGDKTNLIPSFFEGMKSSFEDKVQEDGKYRIDILSHTTKLQNQLLNPNLKTHPFPKTTVEGDWDVFEWKVGDYFLSSKVALDREKYHQNDKIYIRFDVVKLSDALYPENEPWCGRTEGYGMHFYKGADYNSLPLNQQRTLSKIMSHTAPDTDPRPFKLDFGVYSRTLECKFKIKDVVLVNLTMLYGKGNEPTVEWCDENIPYYTDNEMYYIDMNKIQFSSIEPLRKWDKFIFKDGRLMIERGSKVFVLDGNTNGINYTRGFDGAKDTDTNMLFSMKASKEVLPIAGKDGGCSSGICNILPNIYTVDVSTKDVPIGFSLRPYHSQNNYYINIRMNKNRMISNDINGIKDWLNKNNLIVEFPIIEPTYEEIPFELQKIILEGYENGTLFFDTNIPPTSTITYAGETPIVKSVKLNKTEVLSNTEDINDNIIPYLMDMDYRVVCLQLQSENINDKVSMARLFGGVYEMLQRDIQSRRYSIDEYKHRLDAYLDANKITEEEYNKLGDMLNE